MTRLRIPLFSAGSSSPYLCEMRTGRLENLKSFDEFLAA
jgi:hypothetical protein